MLPDRDFFNPIFFSFTIKTRPRNLSSISIIGTISSEAIAFDKIYDTIIVQFGGDSGRRHFDDLWVLTLNEFINLNAKDIDYEHNRICKWRLQRNSTAFQYWKESCDPDREVLASKLCRWEDILLMAWCNKQYQSFLSPF